MIAAITKYFPDLSVRQKEQFSALHELYVEWNDKINVISRKDIDALYERHVLHSLAIAKVISFKPNTSILDVGCGGGFPGIPLAILFPQCKFCLVDSVGKKIQVVKEVAAGVGLTNLQAYHKRAEDESGKYEFVVTRAVAKAAVVESWVRKSVSNNQFNALANGILFLKGGDLQEEFIRFKRKAVYYNIGDFFSEQFFETKQVVYLPI